MKQCTFRIMVALALSLGLTLISLGVLNEFKIGVPVAQAAGVRFVAPGGTDGSNDCANSATPCAAIQHAVDAANPGDIIKVAAGTYTGVNNYSGLTQVVYISKTVTIRGGYTTDFTEPPDPEANPTTLNAQGQGRVLYITGNISPTVEGLRITGGNSGLGDGGGLYVITATATISNNLVFSNVAQIGGGLFVAGEEAVIEANVITANTAFGGGGALLAGGGGFLQGFDQQVFLPVVLKQ